ncbi:MAG: TonB-dependent receptor, partial [Acidobacteriota bacterium]
MKAARRNAQLMKQSLSTLVVLLLLGFGVTNVLYAQAGFDPSKGSVAVDVLDSSGAVIQSAKVTLLGPTGSQSATADTRGQAVFYNLIPGKYAVKVEFQGFRTAEYQNVAVSASQRAAVQARLEPGAVTETVQVTETAVQVDTSSTTTGATITDQTVANLPVARNIASLLTLAPGVASGGGTGASNPSISGASGLENQYVIDGINATDSGYGAFGVYSNRYGSMGTGVNFDFVKEVQVKSGGFEAQYGQALGGIVNVVTHSGTNEIHGAVYAYTAPGFAEGTYKQPNDNLVQELVSETHGRSSYDFGVNIGGPAIQNRLFWYGSFNPSFSTRQRMGPDGLALRTVGELPWKTKNYNWVGKVNFEINANHHLEGTAFGDPSRDPMGFHGSTVRDETLTGEGSSALTYGTRNWAVKYNGLFGANTLLNGQFAWNHTYFGSAQESDGRAGLRPISVRGVFGYTAQFDGTRMDQDPGLA